MSKAKIIRSSVNGSKNGTSDILITRDKIGNYEYEIEFNGSKCPKASSVENEVIEMLDGDKIIKSVKIETNNKVKGRLNVLICIIAFDNFSNEIHQTIDEYIKILIDAHNERQAVTN